MDKKNYFIYRIYKGANVYYQPFKIRRVEVPFVFYLLPQEKDLVAYKVKVNDDEKLIYFRRCFGKIQMGTKKDLGINRIIYIIGKEKKDKSIECFLIDIETKREFHYVGNSIELAFTQTLNNIKEAK